MFCSALSRAPRTTGYMGSKFVTNSAGMLSICTRTYTPGLNPSYWALVSSSMSSNSSLFNCKKTSLVPKLQNIHNCVAFTPMFSRWLGVRFYRGVWHKQLDWSQKQAALPELAVPSRPWENRNTCLRLPLPHHILHWTFPSTAASFPISFVPSSSLFVQHKMSWLPLKGQEEEFFCSWATEENLKIYLTTK